MVTNADRCGACLMAKNAATNATSTSQLYTHRRSLSTTRLAENVDTIIKTRKIPQHRAINDPVSSLMVPLPYLGFPNPQYGDARSDDAAQLTRRCVGIERRRCFRRLRAPIAQLRP